MIFGTFLIQRDSDMAWRLIVSRSNVHPFFESIGLPRDWFPELLGLLVRD